MPRTWHTARATRTRRPETERHGRNIRSLVQVNRPDAVSLIKRIEIEAIPASEQIATRSYQAVREARRRQPAMPPWTIRRQAELSGYQRSRRCRYCPRVRVIYRRAYLKSRYSMQIFR